MGHVYKERQEIKRPPSAHLNRCDGRVYILNNGNPNDRTTIGWATSDDYFHPNDNFRKCFPQEWEKAFSKYNDPKSYFLRAGMYGLCLGVGYSSEVYPVLVEAYDGLYAADIMDYSMYSIFQRSNVSQLYSERMREEVLFSDTVHTDSYWSDLFKEKLKTWQHESFKELWIKRCIARGIRKVWICIDGSNNDNQVQNSDYSEYGDGKSHSGKPIVGYIYAVDAETGEPITYFINPGGVPDCQAFQKIISYLVGYNLEIEGVILDRGFCTYEDLMTLKRLNLKYVIMVPGGTKGSKTMLKKYGRTIFWKSRYAINKRGVFGVSKEEVIWGTHPDVTGILNLYFGAVRGCFDGIKILEEVFDEKERAEKLCDNGKKPVICKKYEDILLVMGDEVSGYWIECDYDTWDEALHSEGFFTMLSSEDFGPKFVYDKYQLRIASEVQYRILKSQEGYDTTRVHTDAGMMSKYAICFAASILRYWIMKSCQSHNLDTNEMIQKMDRIQFLVNDGGKVSFIRDISEESLMLMNDFSLTKESFEEIATDYNERARAPYKSEIRVRPSTRTEKDTPPRRGRPPGSKNKKTLELEASVAKETNDPTKATVPEKKRGRPFGSKDSKPRKMRSDKGVQRGPRKKAE